MPGCINSAKSRRELVDLAMDRMMKRFTTRKRRSQLRPNTQAITIISLDASTLSILTDDMEVLSLNIRPAMARGHNATSNARA